MKLVRIRAVIPLEGYQLQLDLTDGRVVVRDVSSLLVGQAFDPVRSDRSLFVQAKAVDGAVVWPNGADICPDLLIWGGPPPEEKTNAYAPSPADASAVAEDASPPGSE